MQKIITLFQRNHSTDKLVRNEVTPGAEWVINGEGTATRKWDGLAVMLLHGCWYKRYDAKRGRTPPADFIPAQDFDHVTGHWPGWVPCKVDDPSNKLLFDTVNSYAYAHERSLFVNGTYELVGPKIGTRGGANPEKLSEHYLFPHGEFTIDAPRQFDTLKDWFQYQDIEGIVWHHPDGRMVKIKKKDFGYVR